MNRGHLYAFSPKIGIFLFLSTTPGVRWNLTLCHFFMFTFVISLKWAHNCTHITFFSEDKIKCPPHCYFGPLCHSGPRGGHVGNIEFSENINVWLFLEVYWLINTKMGNLGKTRDFGSFFDPTDVSKIMEKRKLPLFWANLENPTFWPLQMAPIVPFLWFCQNTSQIAWNYPYF